MKPDIEKFLPTDNFKLGIISNQLIELFDAAWYASEYPDVKNSGMSAYEHYMLVGKNLGRKSSRGGNAIADNNQKPSSLDKNQSDRIRLILNSNLFDSSYYESQLPNEERRADLILHYLGGGWKKYDPNRYFSTDFYLETVEHLKKTPLEDFIEQGFPFEKNPSKIFNCNLYYLNNPDVKKAQLNPLSHYLSSGIKENRVLSRYDSELIEAKIFFGKSINQNFDGTVLYNILCRGCNLTELQKQTIEYYKKNKYYVILIVNTSDLSNFCTNDIFQLFGPDCVIARENVGFDFGAWKQAFQMLPWLNDCNRLILTNDSVYPISEKSFDRFLNKLHKHTSHDIVFATSSKEIKDHFQSFFIYSATKKGVSKVISAVSDLPYFIRKENLILDVELNTPAIFSSSDITVCSLFTANEKNLNPTIDNWKKLIEEGFPFIKLQLFNLNVLDLSLIDNSLINVSSKTKISAHVAERIRFKETYNSRGSRNIPPIPTVAGGSRFGSLNQVEGYNPPASEVLQLQVPFLDMPAESLRCTFPKTLFIIHCFYIDIAKTILHKISAFYKPELTKILCTTDTAGKEVHLYEIAKGYGIEIKVVITPNRGRDMAPCIIEGLKEIKDHQLVCHLHTKKSPYGDDYLDWGDYLISSLIGSREIFLSNMQIFSNNHVGIIAPTDHFSIQNLKNWGFNFQIAQKICRDIGFQIDANNLLDFPAGSMFIARSDIFAEFSKLNLAYTDFPEEAGQQDGTLAHAIERCLYYLAEFKSYRYIKVSFKKSINLISPKFRHVSQLIDSNLNVNLIGSNGFPVFSADNEIYPINIATSHSENFRLNIVIPTIRPEYTYGGISTALKIGAEIYHEFHNKFPNLDLRFIVTSDQVEGSHYTVVKKYYDTLPVIVEPNDDSLKSSIVPLHHFRNTRLALRENDIFLSTAWWTADLSLRLVKHQERIFNIKTIRNIYLVQDYECGFYSWSPQHVNCKNTYLDPNQIVIYNSEELCNFMSQEFKFSNHFYLPFKLNDNLKPDCSIEKQKVIFVYARPTVKRNLFDIIVSSIKLWQGSNPEKNCKYKVVFAGESICDECVSGVWNYALAGKMSLNEYAKLLNLTAVGISLMQSPHPSYPPLELAHHKCFTITNTYENKDLSLRSPYIISIAKIDPESIKNALDSAVNKFESGLGFDVKVNRLAALAPEYSPSEIASLF